MTLIESIENFKKLYGEEGYKQRHIVTRNGSYVCIPTKKLDAWLKQGWKEIDTPVEPTEAKKAEPKKRRTKSAK